MAAKVVLEDIAKRVGVHRSTVSLALRDHPRISKEMRVRIQALAAKMGYRKNPLVAALMQSRRSGKRVKDVVIAYLTDYPTRYGWRPPYHDRPDYFPGAAERAKELGYKLEHFWLREPGMTPERMSDILRTRGINGVMIGRLPPGHMELHLKWDYFSCMALGMTLRNPNHHRVSEDFFTDAGKAVEQVFRHGYKRVGFVHSEPDDCPRVGDQLLGACLRQQIKHSPNDLVPPFLFEEETDHPAAFAAWYSQYRPDALIVTHAQPVLTWLKGMELEVPRDIGLAALGNDHLDRGWAGIHCNAEKLGALATEMLIGLMHRNETGIPEDPHETLLCGEWVDGWSLSPSVGAQR
jgi:LacI family transcriptional regulator